MRGHDPRVVAEQLLQQPEGLLERALAHVHEEVARRARGRQRTAVRPAPQQRQELRATLVDVDAVLGIGRELAMVGEQQHERARGVLERRHELLFDGRQQLERHGFRARIVRPELVRDRVEVVEVEKRQGWCRCTCELGGERRARPCALDPVHDARPAMMRVNGASTVSAGCTRLQRAPSLARRAAKPSARG